LLKNGRAWSRPLYSLQIHYSPLYEKLREERFIPDDLDAVLSTLPSKNLNYRRSQLLYTLNDAFIIEFGSKIHPFIITEQGAEQLILYRLFFDNRGLSKVNKPYTGSALVRFERSTLPHHKGTRTAVLRFLKIITPVKCVIPSYDGYICCPKEGELYSRNRNNKKQNVWTINIDKSSKRSRGVRLLWDAC